MGIGGGNVQYLDISASASARRMLFVTEFVEAVFIIHRASLSLTQAWYRRWFVVLHRTILVVRRC